MPRAFLSLIWTQIIIRYTDISIDLTSTHAKFGNPKKSWVNVYCNFITQRLNETPISRKIHLILWKPKIPFLEALPFFNPFPRRIRYHLSTFTLWWEKNIFSTFCGATTSVWKINTKWTLAYIMSLQPNLHAAQKRYTRKLQLFIPLVLWT